MTDNQIPSQPDFSTPIKGGRTAKGRNGEHLQRYDSLTECSEARNIPREILAKGNKERPPGIKKGIIYWEAYFPWLMDNYARLQAACKEEGSRKLDDFEYWKLEKLKEEVKEKRNKNRSSDKDYIKRKPVIKTLDDLGPRLSAIFLEDFAKDLPAKCAGMSEPELRDEFKRIALSVVRLFKKPADTWRSLEDMDQAPESSEPSTGEPANE